MSQNYKISELPLVTSNASGDIFPLVQNGVTSRTTLSKIKDYLQTALTFVTSSQLANGLAGKEDKQELSEVLIDATNVSELNNTNCVLSITNFPGGTGNRDIRIKLSTDFAATDWVDLNLRYKGFDLNLRSWDIYEDTGDLYLVIYLNVHGNPTEPVLISLKRTN